jgi:RNA polymerase sigma factor (sigma-70 family)
VEPWLSKLNEGQVQVAWDLFVERYRRLILATIRRLVPETDDVMDAYSSVCEALSANDSARLRRYSNRKRSAASVATWLVVVVRNLTIDWIRTRHGRDRRVAPAQLSMLHGEIYSATCIEGRSFVEAYERIRARSSPAMSYPEFLREVRAVQRAAPCPGLGLQRQPAEDAITDDIAEPLTDPAEREERNRRIAAALAAQPPDVRAAVKLFVIDRLPAADIARLVGWPNPKAVYNRVYRALTAMRAELEGKGIGRGDL